MSTPLKQIKTRIRSIENTRKVTNAMQMVSAAKLSHTTATLAALRPYVSKLESTLHNLVKGLDAELGPFFRDTQQKESTLLCIVSSDGGLCGSYNNNIIHLAEKFIQQRGQHKVRLLLVGKKGFTYFKKTGITILHTFLGLNGKYSEKSSDEIRAMLTDQFLSAAADEVYVAYTHFENSLIHKPTIVKLLNIERIPGEAINYIAEPNRGSVLQAMVPWYISMQVRRMLLESFASEHAARVISMKTATENADELLDELVLLRNKVRQANITQEIMEVISSAEALKG